MGVHSSSVRLKYGHIPLPRRVATASFAKTASTIALIFGKAARTSAKAARYMVSNRLRLTLRRGWVANNYIVTPVDVGSQ